MAALAVGEITSVNFRATLFSTYASGIVLNEFSVTTVCHWAKLHKTDIAKNLHTAVSDYYIFTSIEICEGEVIVSHSEKVYSQYETECREMSFRAATSTIP